MKIIILEGKDETGKSLTMNLVYAYLLNKGAYLIDYSKITYGSPCDFEAILKYEEKSVAIYSLGDTKYQCANAVKSYEEKKIDVLIMAYDSAKFKNHDDWYNRAIKIKKTEETDVQKQLDVNIDDCNQIISKI